MTVRHCINTPSGLRIQLPEHCIIVSTVLSIDALASAFAIVEFEGACPSLNHISLGFRFSYLWALKSSYWQPLSSCLGRTNMTCVSPATSGVGFLDLPAEIRIEIYRYLFEAAQIVVPASQLVTSIAPLGVCSGGFQRRLLDTCWTIRNEALSYLLAATTLHISQPLDQAVPIPPHYLENIPRLVVSDAKAFSSQEFKGDRLPALQVLELHNITIWCKYHSESFFLEDEFGSPTMFGLAQYNLNRISPSLTRLIGGKQRTFKVRLFCQFVVSSASHETIVCHC